MKLVIAWILSHWEAVIIPLSVILYEIIARKQPTTTTFSIIENPVDVKPDADSKKEFSRLIL